MPRIKVRFYVVDTEHGREARSTRTGDPIRSEIKPSTHELVDEAVGEGEREAFREARRASARVAKAVGAERRAAGELPAGRARVRPDAPGARLPGGYIAAAPVFVAAGPPRPRARAAAPAPAPAPRAPRARRPGIRHQAEDLYNRTKTSFREMGDPYDGPADVNTARMMVKLHRYDNGASYTHLMDLVSRHRAHYYKYNPVSHSIELYTHRQMYLASYQLPGDIRSGKVVGVIQHKPRWYLDADKDQVRRTRVYTGGAEGLIQVRDYRVRPPVDRDYAE